MWHRDDGPSEAGEQPTRTKCAVEGNVSQSQANDVDMMDGVGLTATKFDKVRQAHDLDL